MNELSIDVLKLLYDEKEKIIKTGGWSEHKIRRNIDDCDKNKLKLSLQWLKSKRYIDETKINTKGCNEIKITSSIFKISSNGIEFYEKGEKDMGKSQELKQLIDNDLEQIELMESKSYEELLSLYGAITSRYHYCIPKFGSNLYGYMQGTEMYDTQLSEESIKENLNRIKAKLEIFKITGYQVSNENHKLGSQLINITNNNNLDNKIIMNISFEQVRSKIEEMSSISEQEIGEINEKINTLEEIVNANDTKRSKWIKITPILKWIADKGVDVGIAILPLILKI